MEEEAERRRQAPLKLEPEERKPKPHKERPQKRREAERPAEPPAPLAPQKLSDHEDLEEDAYRNGEDSQEDKPPLKPVMRPITAAPSVSSASGNATPNSPANDSPCGIIIPGESTPDLQPLEENRPKIGLSLKLGECPPAGGEGGGACLTCVLTGVLFPRHLQQPLPAHGREEEEASRGGKCLQQV